MARRSFKGNSAPTTLSAGINASVTSIAIADGSTYPDGSAGPFFVVIDKGLVGEEKILVTTRVGNTFTVCTRGQDDETATTHGINATVNHCFTKTDADEANAHVNSSGAVHGLTGSIVGTTDTQTLTSKTLSLASNTVTGTRAQFNAAMSDDDFASLTGSETLTNKTVSLASNTVTGTRAQFNAAMSDDDFATLAGTETLVSKTLTSPSITGTAVITGAVTVTANTSTDPLTLTASGTSNVFTGKDSGGNQVFAIGPTGSFTVGSAAAAGTRVVNLRSNGGNSGNDVVLSASGGTGTSDGDFNIAAGTAKVNNKSIATAQAGGSKIQSGMATVTFSASTSGTATVTFSPAFASAPVIVASIIGGSGATGGTIRAGQSATGSSAPINCEATGVLSTTWAVYWIAIGS